MSGSDCLCLMLGIECWCTRRGPGGIGYRPHGTLAACRRHYRRKEPLCRACKQAQSDNNAIRSRNRPSRSKAAIAARRLAAEQDTHRLVLAEALRGFDRYGHREAA